jgi:hypothetical protein
MSRGVRLFSEIFFLVPNGKNAIVPDCQEIPPAPYTWAHASKILNKQKERKEIN